MDQKMNRKQKRKALKAFNEARKLNGLPPTDTKELDNMIKFKKAYELEHLRVKNLRKRNLLILILAAIAALCSWFGSEWDWLCSIIQMIEL